MHQLEICIREPSEFVSMLAAKKWSPYQNKWVLPADWCRSDTTTRGVQALARAGAAYHLHRAGYAGQATRNLMSTSYRAHASLQRIFHCGC